MTDANATTTNTGYVDLTNMSCPKCGTQSYEPPLTWRAAYWCQYHPTDADEHFDVRCPRCDYIMRLAVLP